MDDRRVAWWVCAAVLALGVAPAAHAQDACEGTAIVGPLDVTPVVGPFPVTLDAPVRVRYSPGYFSNPGAASPAESVELRAADTGMPVRGTVTLIDDTVWYVPDELLEPRTAYEGVARGIDQELPIGFMTGAEVDAAPPRLGRILRMTATKVGASCGAPDGGYRVDVEFEPAVDDGPPGDIEYFLYLSRGPQVDAPSLRARARNLTPQSVVLAFVLEAAEVAGPICVTLHAVDGVGNEDGEGATLCDDLIKGNFFEPLCTAAGPRGGPRSKGWIAALLGLAVLVRRVRPRA